MSVERPYEITHLSPRLHTDFDGLLPEGATGTAEERERNFLSRALAAMAVHQLSGCDLNAAAAAVVDGGQDRGIDAIHYSSTSNTLLIVQSKYIDSGKGEPELGEVSKFKNGIEELLQGNFSFFEENQAWKGRLPQVKRYFEDPVLRVRAVMVYSGINRVSDDRVRLFEDVKRRFSPNDDYFAFVPYSLTSVHDWLTDADGRGVDKAQLEILSPGWIQESYETVYGQVRLKDIASLYTEHGNRLIAANIRRYKGETEVNDRMIATLRDEPDSFFYLNNGLTAYCERLEVSHLDRGNPGKKRVTVYGFSIVNGAQTLGSIQASCGGDLESLPSGMVFLKIISLKGCEDEVEFARRITQSTNFQNQIGSRDFAALDEQQERIAAQLRLDGIEYHYKDSADTPAQDGTNFTLEEATTALACLEQDGECDLLSRVLANRSSLWSFEEVYPGGDLYTTRYNRLFRADRSARTVWRAVQTKRAVVKRMREEATASTSGVRKSFFENARWLVLNLILLRLHSEQGEPLALSADESAAISATTIDVSEKLWTACETKGLVTRRASATGDESYEAPRHFRSVFCSAGDCKLLRDATLALLAATGTPATGPASPTT